jgi:hypothetical protein
VRSRFLLKSAARVARRVWADAGYRARSRRNSRLAADDKQVADEEHSDK